MALSFELHNLGRFFFFQDSNWSLCTFVSTSRWGCSYHQLVDGGNDSHECIGFQTRNHDTRDDVDNHTTIFFTLSTIDKEFSASVTGLAFRLLKLFSVSLCLSPSVLKRMLASRWEFLAYLHSIPRCPHGLPWHACVEKYKRLFLNKSQLFTAENILQSSAQYKICSPFSFYYEPLRKLLLGNSRSSSEILFGQGITDASRSGDNSELSCHLNRSPNTQGMVSHRHKTHLSSRRFSSFLLKSKVKVLSPMVFRSHFFQFLLFSESLKSSAIPDGVAKFLE